MTSSTGGPLSAQHGQFMSLHLVRVLVRPESGVFLPSGYTLWPGGHICGPFVR